MTEHSINNKMAEATTLMTTIGKTCPVPVTSFPRITDIVVLTVEVAANFDFSARFTTLSYPNGSVTWLSPATVYEIAELICESTLVVIFVDDIVPLIAEYVNVFELIIVDDALFDVVDVDWLKVLLNTIGVDLAKVALSMTTNAF